MKRLGLFVTVLFAVLALGITGGIVLAQEPVPSGGSPAKSFAARVAAKLGLEEAKIQDAFNQAARDIQNEAQQQKLDRMVAQGRLTQEQADQIKQWYQARPDALSPRFPFRGPGFHGGGAERGHGRHGMGFRHRAPPIPGSTSHSFGAPDSTVFDWGRIEGRGRAPFLPVQ